MVAKGLKRKLLQNHVTDLGWENRLQSVLNISMIKIQSDQTCMEGNLRRSVLIANMLRQARTQIEAIPENPIKKNRTHHPATCSQQGLAKPSGFEDLDDDFLEDLSLSTTITTILTDLDTAVDCSSGLSDPQQSPLASVEKRTGDVTCRRSLSNHLPDGILDDLILDFDSSLCNGERRDHMFDHSADEFVTRLPGVPCLGSEIGFFHSL